MFNAYELSSLIGLHFLVEYLSYNLIANLQLQVYSLNFHCNGERYLCNTFKRHPRTYKDPSVVFSQELSKPALWLHETGKHIHSTELWITISLNIVVLRYA